MSVTIYHNPRCSKSRTTLALLQDKGVETEVVEYLKTPPDAATLESLLGKLGLTARDVMRKGEDVYKQLNLADTSLTEADLIKAMAENPILIERPIVVKGEKAVLGRPPENVLKLI